MSDLIEALNIFLKYNDSYCPTNCSHDQLVVCVEPDLVSEEDTERLDELGFFVDDSGEYFVSFRFGSA